jgi:hypothetical protein
MNFVVLILIVIDDIKVLVLLHLRRFQRLLLLLSRLLLPFRLNWHNNIILLNGLTSPFID